MTLNASGLIMQGGTIQVQEALMSYYCFRIWICAEVQLMAYNITWQLWVNLDPQEAKHRVMHATLMPWPH